MQGEAPLERHLAPSMTPTMLFQKKYVPRNIFAEAGCSHEPLPTRPAHSWEGAPKTGYEPAACAACKPVIHYFSIYYPQPPQEHIASMLQLHPSPQQLPKRCHQARPGPIFGVTANLKLGITPSWNKLSPQPFWSIPGDGPTQLPAEASPSPVLSLGPF